MSRDQISEILKTLKDWSLRVLAVCVLWFLSEIYSEFKQAKADIQQIKEDLSSIKTAIKFLDHRAEK